MIRPVVAWIVAVVVAFALAMYVARRFQAHRADQPSPNAFVAKIDLSPMSRVAVHYEGRLRSFDSHASSLMQVVGGPHRIHGLSAGVAYLDLMFRPESYHDADVVYVKNKLVRAQLAKALKTSLRNRFDRLRPDDPDDVAEFSDGEQRLTEKMNDWLDVFLKDGLISPVMLHVQVVQDLLLDLEQDVIRTKKDVDAIRSATTVMSPSFLRGALRIVPPSGGGLFDPWRTLDDVAAAPGDGHGPAASTANRQALAERWAALEQAWVKEDAAAVNNALAGLASALPAVNAELYPQEARLAWESWYFKAGNMTWVWLLYAVAFVPLMLSLVYRWSPARWLGLGLFLLAFGFHTFALGLRWYVSGRWPNSNMFEAVTTAAWFGAVAAIVLELLARRTAMRNVFALCSAVACAAAFMAVHFLPVQLNANISNMMPVLHDVWLYIHTNVIIFSYALIAMASVPAGIQLLYRLGGGAADFARVGGAGSLIMAGADGGAARADADNSSVARVLDGTTMVLMELAFVLLWTGLCMGAIWADHSWGRPWGWDPKEVFALNTFIIFALLVHVRLKVKDKSLWTAVLAVVGCAVMLFNWIIINFTISGLHSYA